MKKQIIAVLAAIGMCVSMAGCTISTPKTVGTIGDVEITSGMYLLNQFQAFNQAQNQATAGMATDDVKKFLKQTFGEDYSASSAASDASSAAVSSDAASSEAASSEAESAASGDASDEDSVDGQVVGDYVAAETLRNMQYYAAVTTRFAELGGELTAEEIAAADSQAQQIWDGNSALYAANGFNLDTIKEYEYTLTKADDLLEMVYGADGEQPISDEEVTDYLENDMIYGYYITVPMYNASSYTFADTDQQTEIKNACLAVLNEYSAIHAGNAVTVNEAGSETAVAPGSIYEDFAAAVYDKLGDAYAVMDNEFDPQNTSVTANFISDANLDYFDDPDSVRNCEIGEGVVVTYSSYAYEIFVREDPLAENELEDVRSAALEEMKGTELQDSLYAYGADTLENKLDSGAMKQMPAGKIKLTTSASAA